MANNGSNIPTSSRKNGQPSSKKEGREIDLYTQLWLACAGSLVQVPQAGDKVFYFPQGHIEQVEGYMSRDGNIEMPIYNLPSKTLCKVVNIQLKAEANTDEVFAQITLLPESEESGTEVSTSKSKPRKAFSMSFSKKLTPSDTSTHGGFSVPKRHAGECFPPLVDVNRAREHPTQDLVAKDLNGTEWMFRHVYRGQPRRNLITSGWSVFVSSKKLVAGDTVFFFRGEGQKLLVGVRRASRPQNSAPTSFISGLSIQLGILATAFHAMSTGSMFTVYYRPWSSPGEFIIPYDQYVRSTEIGYSSGMRFRMQFEVEDSPDYKCIKSTGKIIGVEDVDHLRWPDSDWKRLKVKWDGISDAPDLPERVSPWSIELFNRCKMKQPLPVTPNLKRSYSFDPLTPNVPFQVKRVLQGQETTAIQNPPKRVHIHFCAPDFQPCLKKDEAETSNSTRCMLFGVDIMNSLPSPKGTTSQSSVAQTKKSPEKQCLSSCTKIMKYGNALGRRIDLACFDGYDKLVSEIDRMFEFKGSLRDGSSGWHVTYLDIEGDMMLLGDWPWPEFRAMVKKMYIYPAEDTENAGPSS